MLARQVVAQLELRRTARASEKIAARCRQILAQASDGIHLFDFDGRITAANEKFCELTGRSEAELLDLRVEDLISPGDLIETPTNFEDLRGGKTRVSRRNFVRPDGELVAVEVSCKKFDETTIQAIVRDVTERREIERKLLSSESRFRNFVTNSLALFCTHDLTGAIETINPAAAKSLGYAEEELVGKSLAEILTPEAKRLLPAYLAQTKTDGEARGLMWILTKSGERRVWSYSNVLCREGEDREYILGSAQDITELKRSEEELRESQNRFFLFIDNSSTVIFMKNENGSYETANRSFEELFGARREDLKGKTDFDIFPPEIAESLRANDRIVLETGETVKTVVFVPAADGTPHHWLSHKFLIEDGAGKKFVGGIAVNITERKQIEEELRRARDAALESAQLKSAFLTNVSHEIRTPLNGVIGMTELLLDSPLDDAQCNYAEIIRQSSDALLIVINDILDIAKIESGKLRFETIDFDPRLTIESTVEMLRERAVRKNIEITSLIEAGVPQILRGDPGRLRQILTNLVGNAVKFTERGGVRVEVKIAAGSARRLALRFEVADTGIGIEKKNLKNLFQPFVQIDDSTTRQYGGTGLGLVISKQLIEMMGGEITVSSEPGKGSRFSFTAFFDCLPESERADKIAVSRPSETVDANDDSLNNHLMPPRRRRDSEAENDYGIVQNQANPFRILVVEDNEVNRLLNLSQLKKIGIAADVAFDGVDALEKIAAADYRLVFMDCQMPRLDGYQAAREIRRLENLKKESPQKYAPTTIIALTAHTLAGEREKCLAAGMDDFLTKPLKIADLTAMIRFWAAKSAAHATDSPKEISVGAAPSRRLKKEKRFPSDFAPPTAAADNFNADLSPEIIEIYFTETRRQIGEIELALKNRDAAAVRRVAHAARGNALAVGARQVARVAALIEADGLENDFEKLSFYIRRLNAECSLLAKPAEV